MSKHQNGKGKRIWEAYNWYCIHLYRKLGSALVAHRLRRNKPLNSRAIRLVDRLSDRHIHRVIKPGGVHRCSNAGTRQRAA